MSEYEIYVIYFFIGASFGSIVTTQIIKKILKKHYAPKLLDVIKELKKRGLVRFENGKIIVN